MRTIFHYCNIKAFVLRLILGKTSAFRSSYPFVPRLETHLPPRYKQTMYLKMHAEVLLVLILTSFDTYMMVPIRETLQSPIMEEPSSDSLKDATIINIAPKRCGFRDEELDIENPRRKRYISELLPTDIYMYYYLFHLIAEPTNLTYKVILDSSDRPSWFNEEAILNEIKAAFEYWGRESPLEFTYQPDGPVDITIKFTSNQLACGDRDTTFGKQYGTLGCAGKPPNRNIFLDIAEDWTINDFRGTNIFQVATHEIGHALGLYHSKNDASVMLEKYPGNRKYFRTAPDDIRAIQKLHGSRKGRELIDEESTVYKEYVP